MRRAFTLIELLVIVAIMAVLVAASVMNVRSGQDAARLRGATRDIFAAIRHARSLALVSKQPSVVTYSTEKDGEDVCAKVVVDGAKIINRDAVKVAWTLSGERVALEPEEDGGEGARLKSHTVNGEAPVTDEGGAGGETLDEILFAPVAADVVRGVRLRVVKDESELAAARDSRRAKPRISVFSNVDYLIGRHNEAKAAEKKESAGAADASDAAAPEAGDQEPVKIVWEVNGRTEPHRIWVYLDGREPETGLSISVDRFGGMKVLGRDGEEVGR